MVGDSSLLWCIYQDIPKPLWDGQKAVWRTLPSFWKSDRISSSPANPRF